MACFFHSPTIVGWMPCLVTNCAVVSSPRSASSATFALNSAEYRFRLLSFRSVLLRSKPSLSYCPNLRYHLTHRNGRDRGAFAFRTAVSPGQSHFRTGQGGGRDRHCPIRPAETCRAALPSSHPSA